MGWINKQADGFRPTSYCIIGIILSLLFNENIFLDVNSFAVTKIGVVSSALSLAPATTYTFSSSSRWSRNSTSSLFAAGGSKKKKKKNKKNRNGNSGNSISSAPKKRMSFGGAAMEPCPCGRIGGIGVVNVDIDADTDVDVDVVDADADVNVYSSCCGKLHQDLNIFRSATAEQIVRARYSAYAKKQPEFLIKSTHPNHKDFDNDLRRWKETIKTNMYDNFDMPKCVIVKENYDNNYETVETIKKTATVQFIAEMSYRETGETISFMETSIFQKATKNGPWLYLSGTIEEAPGAVPLVSQESDNDDNDNDHNNGKNDDNKPVNKKQKEGDNNKFSMEEKIASMLK
mmetsp:Transcript_12342/g.13952  ORF Transcript_12342/g.13952 Transcript_12342/m.13952 type:complete len:345 (-) Transcript_12342:9-1043(-)